MPKKSPNKYLALYNKLQREFKVLNDKNKKGNYFQNYLSFSKR